MARRIHKQATIFNARIVSMRNLWEPSREYMGKPAEKPNYLASFIVPKTRTNWYEEAQFAGLVQASQELYAAAMSHIPFAQISWPIRDGDVAEPGKTPAEWARGHWYLTGSSSSPIETNIVQGGVPVKISNRAGVKPGDFVAAGIAIAVNSNDQRRVKCYINSVLFMASGEEIAIGNSVSAAELMAQAKAQGLNVTGFGGQSAGLLPQVGFGAPQAGFTHPGPHQGQPGTSMTTFPSNPAPQGFAPPPAQPPAQGGFTTLSGFNPPQGFPQR
jgi:hypothetical protein